MRTTALCATFAILRGNAVPRAEKKNAPPLQARLSMLPETSRADQRVVRVAERGEVRIINQPIRVQVTENVRGQDRPPVGRIRHPHQVRRGKGCKRHPCFRPKQRGWGGGWVCFMASGKATRPAPSNHTCLTRHFRPTSFIPSPPRPLRPAPSTPACSSSQGTGCTTGSLS